jgi:uncharacterized radical SAM superfamily protein
LKQGIYLIITLGALGIIIYGCSKPQEWEISQWYTQMSHYKDSEVRAYSFHIKVFDEDKIQKICDYYVEKYADTDRYMRLDFYDDRTFTPDYSRGINPTEAQEQHMVARFIYDPITNNKRLEMFK